MRGAAGPVDDRRGPVVPRTAPTCALFLSGDPALADDLVAETFVRLWNARERVDLPTVRGYLFTIARNLYLQERRGRPPAAELNEALADRGPGPEAQALAREADALRAGLALPPTPAPSPSGEKRALDATRALLHQRRLPPSRSRCDSRCCRCRSRSAVRRSPSC